MSTEAPDLSPASTEDPEQLQSFLLQFGIWVDPTYHLVTCVERECQKVFHYQNIYRHKERKHYQNTNRTLKTRLPPRSEVLSAIHALGGFNPSDPRASPSPIVPIAGVEIVNGSKCTIQGCSGHVYVSRNSLWKHQSTAHPTVNAKDRSKVSVKCQSLNAIKQYRFYVEVLPPTSVYSSRSGLELILKAADVCNLLKQDDVFTLASSEREKCAVFAQSHWDELLDGVSAETLIQTASASSHFSNPCFLLLRDYVREYYQDIVPTLDAIPVLARRYLLTPKIKYVD